MTQNRIKVGIVGVHPDKGWAAIAHIPALKLLPENEIAAISHHDLDVARAAAEKFGVPSAVGTTEGLVNHPDVDLIVIAVKVPRHRELVTQVIEAGKSVLCEWPLGVDLNDALGVTKLAKDKGVHTAIGLQTRSAPAINFVREMIQDGYVGHVRSTTLIASGLAWGDEMNETFKYTLDPSSGASMLPVTFGHSIDAILYALQTRLRKVTGTLASVRKTTCIIETGEAAAMNVPDQIAVSGFLENGAFVNAHIRGGLSRATNFHWEINGSGGDLVVTTPVAYIGAGGYKVKGAQGQEMLHDLDIPAHYGASSFEDGIPQSMAIAYRRLASDILSGTKLSPTFDDGVNLHRLIATIEASNVRPRDV
jgi:predicted dehydrogenase